MGPHLAVDLERAGIVSHSSAALDIDEAARQFARGELPRLQIGEGCDAG